MLVPGKIPTSEPLLRVGIILPEDEKKQIVLEIPVPQDYSLIIDEQQKPMPLKGKLTFRSGPGGIRCEDIMPGGDVQKIKLVSHNRDSWITVRDVVAGRGFHWLKHIPVKLPSSVEVENRDGNLILINELPIEVYLACVSTSEMSAECPPAYIEAQTIVARSWMLANVEQKHKNLGIDVCNDDCCQRYQGLNNITEKSFQTALGTSGMVLMWQGMICDARYSKSCGGITEKYENLWEGEPPPYLTALADAPDKINIDLTREKEMETWVNSVPKTFCSPHYIEENELIKYLGDVDVEGKYFRWSETISQTDLVTNLRTKTGYPVDKVLDLIPLERGPSGRMIRLEIRYLSADGDQRSAIIEKDYNVRNALHSKFLYSSAIVIEKGATDQDGIPASFTFRGAGWGHGAGMCQIGALGMALHGYTSENIVKHYFPGTELKKIY